jgi:orotidine-5'-phosphate decarboxylase
MRAKLWPRGAREIGIFPRGIRMSEIAPKYGATVLARTRKAGNALCVGLDPVLAKIPRKEGSAPDRIRRFYVDLLEAMSKRGLMPAAVKPNIAYFEALGWEALQVLQALAADFRGEGILWILDAKRGDISTSSTAYADMAFERFAADAVTVAPYMGSDSIGPFQDKAKGRGIYVLVRTSNAGARDFQDLMVDWEESRVPLFHVVARKLAEWDRGDLGAVVGATSPRELERLVVLWRSLGKEIPMLIPGISVSGVSGGQGGDVAAVIRAIRNAGGNPGLHLLNSSSGVNYAYERFPGIAPAEASLRAMEELLEAAQKSGA